MRLAFMVLLIAGIVYPTSARSQLRTATPSNRFVAILAIDGARAEGRISEVPIRGARQFTVQLGLSMGQPIKDWIEASANGTPSRKSGSLRILDAQRRVRHIREFKDALLTEISFPALDGASKEPAYLSLRFSVSPLAAKSGDGSVMPATLIRLSPKSSFQVKIKGVNTSRIAKVEGMTFIQKTAAAATASPSPLMGPQGITIVMPYNFYEAWPAKWYVPELDRDGTAQITLVDGTGKPAYTLTVAMETVVPRRIADGSVRVTIRPSRTKVEIH